MLKKFFVAALLGATLIFAGLQSPAEARDIYVGTSPATGWNCFLMEETVRGTSVERFCTLKMVTNSGNVEYLNYRFSVERSGIYFYNSQGYSGWVSGDTPIEQNMWNAMI